MVVAILGGVAIMLALIALGVATRYRAEGRKAERRGRLLRAEGQEMKDHAEERTGGKITIEHKQDPVLGPRQMLVVMLPDPDWEVIHEMQHALPTTMVADTKEAMEKFANAEYVIGVLANSGHVVIAKWRDWPEGAIEVIPYGAE